MSLFPTAQLVRKYVRIYGPIYASGIQTLTKVNKSLDVYLIMTIGNTITFIWFTEWH
jgi:hypothetical protein